MSDLLTIWTHRLALATAGATAALIVAGGLVTNTGSALAVPDWPTTFGHNMFLYPLAGMTGGVLYEHGHRLLGALVGFLTLGLAVGLWVTERRAWVRALAVAAVALVGVQGLLGGLRVVLLRDDLAIVHGAVAHLFFALIAALCVFTSRAWGTEAGAEATPAVRRLFRLAVGVATALYGQIVLGALTTHAGWTVAHVIGAGAVVVGGTALAAWVLAELVHRPALARLGRLLAALLVLQVGLGVGAAVTRFTDLAGVAVVALAVPVAHRVTAALLLGATVMLMLHLGRLRDGVVAPGVRPAEVSVGSLRTRVPA